MTTAGGLVFFANDAEAFEAVDATNRQIALALQHRAVHARFTDELCGQKESSMWPLHPAAICLPSHYRKVVFGRAWS